MYIWLLIKLFLGRVYEQEKKKMCIQVLWLSFNVLKKKEKKNPNVSIMRS